MEILSKEGIKRKYLEMQDLIKQLQEKIKSSNFRLDIPLSKKYIQNIVKTYQHIAEPTPYEEIMENERERTKLHNELVDRAVSENQGLIGKWLKEYGIRQEDLETALRSAIGNYIDEVVVNSIMETSNNSYLNFTRVSEMDKRAAQERRL